MTATQDPLDRLETRLSAIEARLDRMMKHLEEGRLHQLEPAVAMATDSIDEWAARQIQSGVDVDAHLSSALSLLHRLTDPALSASLERLLTLLPKLLPMADLVSRFEPTTAMMFDTIDEEARRLDARGIDVEERLVRVMGLVERLTEPAFHVHLTELLDAAPGLMAATRTGELFGRALDEVVASNPAPAGWFALLGSLSRPDVQRVLGLAIAVADHVGQQMSIQSSKRS